jgi:DeoR/GlpR family transcriptional regulator of sugar metabolism
VTDIVGDEANLFTPERRKRIRTVVLEQGRATVPRLSQQFRVSEVTIRKDLAWLEGAGQVQRVHGGAVVLERDEIEHDFARREKQRQEEKARIGRVAAELVHNGDTIALDSSSTALALARCLRERRGLTVITNGLRTAQELVGAEGVTILMPGGIVRPESLSLVGGWGASMFSRVHIARVFLGAQGITMAEGLMDVNTEEVIMKREMMEAAREVVALVDHSKWGHIALATSCAFERIAHIVTNEPVASEFREAVGKRGITLHLA